MEKEIFIYRHGETELNRQGVVQGSGVDAPLNRRGHEQAQAFFERYGREPFEAVLTSTLLRTHQTVRPFLDQGIPWEQFPEINEICWGAHEGKKSTPPLLAAYRQTVAEWQAGNLDARLDQGESAAEMAVRLERFIAHLVERPEKKLLVCSHGRAMRCLICLLKGQPLQEMESYHHANTGLYLVRYHQREFEFVRENDTEHLVVER
ncbi:MAG: histidine phosphatase family protein [Saprospiraceae bacterium]|nr:histidine phosphatase family protein [Saprospiraceae bacterium]MCB0623925.1 histidine phosphatase family protein [Saprospiraceae bacterium]MCB0678477.1 histidine phosphatase family protein [Saprospiraceae bacterium]MCB0682507.1 histidine phosphatase family protein [Saprospiraceae bacterium]